MQEVWHICCLVHPVYRVPDSGNPGSNWEKCEGGLIYPTGRR